VACARGSQVLACYMPAFVRVEDPLHYISLRLSVSNFVARRSHDITPRNWVLLDQPVRPQLAKKLSAFLESEINYRHWALSWARWIQSIPWHHISGWIMGLCMENCYNWQWNMFSFVPNHGIGYDTKLGRFALHAACFHIRERRHKIVSPEGCHMPVIFMHLVQKLNVLHDHKMSLEVLTDSPVFSTRESEKMAFSEFVFLSVCIDEWLCPLQAP
jgi:hypothetical protein